MRAFIVILLMFFSSSVWSCICHKLSDTEAFKQAKSVFIAQITSTEFTEVTEKRAFNYVSAKFQIIETYKGEPGKLKELRSEKDECELPLVAGEFYLVFHTANDYELLNTCTTSRWLNMSKNRESTIIFQGSNNNAIESIK